MEIAPDAQSPQVGPAGVLIFRGSTFAIKDLRLSFDDQGNLTSSMRPQIAWELWPLWLRVAVDHEAVAAAARRELASADGDRSDGKRAQLIEDETRAGMVAITAAAFALEAMALSAATRAHLPGGIGRSASTARRIAEVLKQCFVIPPDRFADWRQAIVEIFEARNAAVHPDSGLRDPMPHPALHAAVPRPAHVYRLENTSAAVTTALTTATLAARSPRPRLGKDFRRALAAGPASPTNSANTGSHSPEQIHLLPLRTEERAPDGLRPRAGHGSPRARLYVPRHGVSAARGAARWTRQDVSTNPGGRGESRDRSQPRCSCGTTSTRRPSPWAPGSRRASTPRSCPTSTWRPSRS